MFVILSSIGYQFPLFDSTFHSATTYLDELMQKDFKLTSGSKYIPETLLENLTPTNTGINILNNVYDTESWLHRTGVIKTGNIP